MMDRKYIIVEVQCQVLKHCTTHNNGLLSEYHAAERGGSVNWEEAKTIAKTMNTGKKML